MNSYKYDIEQEGKYWIVSIPELGLTTQARTLRETDQMAKSIISLRLEVDPDTIAVHRSNVIGLPGSLARDVNSLVERRDAFLEERDVIAEETVRVAKRLTDAGMPLRDAGYLLGLSHQRIAQLVSPEGEGLGTKSK